jgi:hypothetical protein
MKLLLQLRKQKQRLDPSSGRYFHDQDLLGFSRAPILFFSRPRKDPVAAKQERVAKLEAQVNKV